MNLNTIVYQSRYSSSAHTRTLTLSLTVLGILSVLLFCIPIFHAWQLYPYSFQNSTASYSALSGIFPWSDANGYYDGAYQLLDKGLINAWNSRRPLNVSLLTTRLWLSNFNLQMALIIQAVLCGLSAFSASAMVANSFGEKAGFLTFGVLFLFIHNFLPTTLSEPLGLTLGCVAFTFLWDAAQRKNISSLFLGALTLMCALNARAGAFLVLPLLGIWVLFQFATSFPKRSNYLALLIFILGLAFGVFCNILLSWLYTDGSGAAHSNFSLTLFGVVLGGKGWTYAYDLYPDISKLSESQLSEFLYHKCFTHFLDEPTLVFVGLWKNFLKIFKHSLVFFWQGLPDSALLRALLRLVGAFALIHLCLQFKRHYNQHKPFFTLLLAGMMGMFLSALIILQDGGSRVFAATVPFLAATIGVTVSLYLRKQTARGTLEPSKLPLNISYVLTVLLLSAGLFAPILIHKTHSDFHPSVICPVGYEPILVKDLAIAPQLALPMDAELYKQNVVNSTVEYKDNFLNVLARSTPSNPSRLSLVYNAIKQETQYIFGPEELFAHPPKWSCLCGKVMPTEDKTSFISEVIKGTPYE